MQIVAKEHGVRRIVEHLGSAHDEAELAVLVQAGRKKSRGGQEMLDLAGLTPQAARQAAPAPLVGQRSALLWDVLCGAYETLRLDEAAGRDEGFRQMVLARLAQPSSKEQVPAVLGAAWS